MVANGKAGNPYPQNFNVLTSKMEKNSSAKPVQTTNAPMYKVFDILLNSTMKNLRSADSEIYLNSFKAFYKRMKKTSGVNFINILCVHLRQYFGAKKLQSQRN